MDEYEPIMIVVREYEFRLLQFPPIINWIKIQWSSRITIHRTSRAWFRMMLRNSMQNISQYPVRLVWLEKFWVSGTSFQIGKEKLRWANERRELVCSKSSTTRSAPDYSHGSWFSIRAWYGISEFMRYLNRSRAPFNRKDGFWGVDTSSSIFQIFFYVYLYPFLATWQSCINCYLKHLREKFPDVGGILHQDWKIKTYQLMAFVGIKLIMAYIKLPKLRDYWFGDNSKEVSNTLNLIYNLFQNVRLLKIFRNETSCTIFQFWVVHHSISKNNAIMYQYRK